MELSFSNLKMGCVQQKGYVIYANAIKDIANHIVGFYNSTKLHSKLGNVSPNVLKRNSTPEKPMRLYGFDDHHIVDVWWSSYFGHINRVVNCRFTLESVG